ncbi:hypothetical protein T492DRAFT_1150390 [Pavlovales sp. CCMP2436]|nr:hypothetical protein T492DRAFT_1150390 [Pavlovales sp. CCMP2436]
MLEHHHTLPFQRRTSLHAELRSTREKLAGTQAQLASAHVEIREMRQKLVSMHAQLANVAAAATKASETVTARAIMVPTRVHGRVAVDAARARAAQERERTQVQLEHMQAQLVSGHAAAAAAEAAAAQAVQAAELVSAREAAAAAEVAAAAAEVAEAAMDQAAQAIAQARTAAIVATVVAPEAGAAAAGAAAEVLGARKRPRAEDVLAARPEAAPSEDEVMRTPWEELVVHLQLGGHLRDSAARAEADVSAELTPRVVVARANAEGNGDAEVALPALVAVMHAPSVTAAVQAQPAKTRGQTAVNADALPQLVATMCAHSVSAAVQEA